MCYKTKSENVYVYVDVILAVVDPVGGPSDKMLLKMCFVNIDIKYSLTKYGFWSTSEVI